MVVIIIITTIPVTEKILIFHAFYYNSGVLIWQLTKDQSDTFRFWSVIVLVIRSKYFGPSWVNSFSLFFLELSIQRTPYGDSILNTYEREPLTTADVTTANVTLTDVLVLGYGL